MVELVLIFCLIGDVDRCIERREPIGDGDVGMACTVRAQQIAGEYIGIHPGWMLRGWRCEKDAAPKTPA